MTPNARYVITTLFTISFTYRICLCLIDPVYLFPSYKQCACGVPNDNKTRDKGYLKIIGGEETGYHEYPWLVQLQHDGRIICGGSIISDLFVVSAAHCYRNDFEQTKFKVIVGQHDSCTDNNDVTIISVRKVLQHEDFDIRTFSADIMLLKLSLRLTFSKYISPLCLPRYGLNIQRLYYGRKGVIIGWGIFQDLSLTISCIPRKAFVPIVSKSMCNSSYASTLFCAGYPEGGVGFCEGDSGGGLLLRNDYGQYELIGIISNSLGCAKPGHYGFYTDVTIFLPWLLGNIYGSKWC